MFKKNERPGQVIWRDIVPVAAFTLALLFTFWTRQYSDMPSNALPMNWSIHDRAASYQHWTTVWPTVARFDRPVATLDRDR